MELLIYSPSLCTLSPRLCYHTTPPPFPWPPHDSPPSTRFNIVRHFLYIGPHNAARHKIVFRTAQSPALFEVRIPQLQLSRGRGLEIRPSPSNSDQTRRKLSQDSNEEKKELRREIQAWWQSISDHMDRLVCAIICRILRSANDITLKRINAFQTMRLLGRAYHVYLQLMTLLMRERCRRRRLP